MRSNRHILVLLIVSLLLLAVSVGLNYYLFGFSRQYYLQLNSTRLDPLGLDYFSTALNQAEQSAEDTVHVVFFGDSRALEWPAPTIAGFQFLNRGIGAQTSAQVLQRYNAHIKPLSPDVLVVQVCINDLKTIPLFPEWKANIIANCKDNLQQIVQQATSQEAMIILTTIFPTGKAPFQRKLFWSDEIPSAITEVNAYIKSLETEQVVIFDAFLLLADENGRLRQEYSRDELHLNTAGYEALNREFEQLLSVLEK